MTRSRYDPHRVLSKLTERLFVKYRTDSMKDKGQVPIEQVPLSRDHINCLNTIGLKILSLHDTGPRTLH